MFARNSFLRQDQQDLQDEKGGFAAENFVNLVDPVLKSEPPVKLVYPDNL